MCISPQLSGDDHSLPDSGAVSTLKPMYPRHRRSPSMEVDTRSMIVDSLSVPIWQRHQRSVAPVMLSKRDPSQGLHGNDLEQSHA